MALETPGVAFITGAGSGIGRATALLFAKEGCNRIAIADINQSALDELKDLIQSRHPHAKVATFQIDITSESSVNNAVLSTVEVFGRIDYACNAAGILLPGPTDEISVSDFDRQQEVNLRGTWLCQRAEIRQMLQQEPVQAENAYVSARGAIANVASMCALMAYDHLPAYCASKHGILGFTRADGLRTPMLGHVPDGQLGKDVDSMVSDMAVGRLGFPEEVAECLLWITSPRSSLVTGSMIAPNGGMVGI
ncbi:hypothetical protein FDECE_9077 [Fusarium decemcellulare]|nr:hypothetical protein FDECE_9077 [Fusarium decemcellulare]